ncbi:unnamed protein product [Rotaria magnacalcarata]|uniref:Brain tumor protein n=1 Tax=Rotaria magnacalcarata TaxID=392030 RepID=A0A816MZR5_9BILA|nr:unnamed protein product [Rotaria magnacalcarata]CAF1658504.1 unnamed protein product [Rotaria magnacalcarata]CAF2031134.1 unnamed protein product [Rotaria magnacalcarata]CAF2049379.1 unnamed protein product [Rotaria magnacalcarata]CAF2096428.1 unnamed protein product [Rotaria magnacalcarata]
MSTNNENGMNNDETSTKENEDSLFNLEDDDNKQELNEDNQLKCFLCKQLFNQPKFLSCTHTYCLQCCEKLIKNNSHKDQFEIQCPICQQITEISNINMLVDNYLLIHEIENLALKTGSIQCRACTSNDVGVAHCSTCSSYLCSKCCQAHQYMKCFEQHHVRRLSQIENDEEYSNRTCQIHSNNQINFYCKTCSLNLCEQCLLLHPTSQHDIQKNPFEQIRSDLNDKINQIDQIRSTALANLDHQLTSLQHDYDKAKTQVDLAHTQYQQVLNEVYKECLSSLSILQRDEEMRLIDKLETIQKGSQSFDDSRSVFQRCLDKCSLNELVQLKTKLFDDKLNSFQQLFQIESNYFKINDEQQQKHDLVQFLSTPIQEFQQIIKLHFGQLIKPESKQISSPINNHYQRGSLLSSTNGDSVSSSSGVGSIGLGQISSRGTILSNGVSPSGTNRDDYFVNCSTNENEPVVENLRALESIFVDSLSTIHPNVQRNLEEMLQLNHQQLPPPQENPYTMLTRQSSAPPLGQRSPSNSIIQYPPPSLVATYSSTNSGGSSNGNNSRSTTPFSGITQNSTIDVNLNVLSQTSLMRRCGQSMQVRAKFGSLGPQKCQFNAPHGFCLGIDEEIIVADTNNHRIQIFDKNGEYKYQFGMPGKEEGQLWYPRKVAVIRQTGKFVICDRGNERSRMQIFTRNGHFIRKISIRYIDIVAGLAITQQGNIVAVDSVSPTVFCISESGDLLKWFDCSDYMREPSDIAIFNNEYFVCDFKGHCVVVFDEDGTFLRRIGSESVTNFPNGIDISDAGDVIIGDSHGNRFHIAVFTRTGDFLQEFDCPYVKVSRCCGLKITSDGFIVTLAKNNHHVLVLNTLYLT